MKQPNIRDYRIIQKDDVNYVSTELTNDQDKYIDHIEKTNKDLLEA